MNAARSGAAWARVSQPTHQTPLSSMKYLDIPALSLLSAYLSSREVGDTLLTATLETFSCKAAGSDKKLGKVLERQYSAEASAEPKSPVITSSPLGDMSAPATRRLLINLIATLNASFPDYDFVCTKPDEFLRVYDYRIAVAKVNKHLAEIIQSDGSSVVDSLWGSIDEAVNLKECQVFTYIPNLDSDPFSEDTLWSFNFFFVNPVQKKILYFTCLARSKFNARALLGAASDASDTERDEDTPFEPTSQDGRPEEAAPAPAPVFETVDCCSSDTDGSEDGSSGGEEEEEE